VFAFVSASRLSEIGTFSRGRAIPSGRDAIFHGAIIFEQEGDAPRHLRFVDYFLRPTRSTTAKNAHDLASVEERTLKLKRTMTI
jgi:hypothetical protein